MRDKASAAGPPRPAPALLAAGVPVLCAALFALHVAAFRPGIMTWDAIRQYGQALSGRYDDWHPPAMSWLWRQMLAFGDGPMPMLVLQAALYWGGVALISTALVRRARCGAAAIIVALALLPIPLVLVGTVLKDSLFVGALLLACGLIVVRSREDRVLRVLAALLLVAAATLRFNALPACLPLLVILAPAAWRATWPRLALTSIAAAIPLLLALPVANALLHAERSGAELSLVIYDLGGIARFGGTDAFPPVPVARPVEVVSRCYTPVSWDRFAWWGPEPCAIGFDTVRAALRQTRRSPYAFWLAAIMRHPAAYARHRLGHFNDNIRLLVRDGDLPTLSLASDPNRWSFAVPLRAARSTVAMAALATLHTPLGWAACWIALGIGLLILMPDLRTGRPAVALAWSGVLYAFGYLPLSVASEVRYHFWTMTGIGVAATLLWADREALAVSTRRWVAAAAPLVAVMAACYIARVVG